MSTATSEPTVNGAPSPFVVEATNSGGGSGEVPSEGNHPAVLIGLVDLGTHTDEYQGKEYTNKKVLFCWEIPGEIRSDGAPFVVTADFNMPPKLSGKSKLRSMIEAWRGRPMEDTEQLDMARMLGAPCLLNIGHGKSAKGNGYAKILGISPMIRGMAAPKPFNAPFVWSSGMGGFNPPDWLPFLYGKPVEDVIGASHEAKGRPATASGTRPSEDADIPF